MTDPATIDATLDLLTPDELATVHRFVEVWERAGFMSPAERVQWTKRIQVWQRFRLGVNDVRLTSLATRGRWSRILRRSRQASDPSGS